MAVLAMAHNQQRPEAQLLQGYSFEISAKDAHRLAGIRSLVPSGTIVSITYLPNESDDARVAAAKEARKLGLIPMPHIAARRITSRETLSRFLERLSSEAQIDRLFVIAGDLSEPLGPFADALSLIQGTRFEDYGVRTVGIAGYPEGHPQIPRDQLDLAITAKLHALAAQGQGAEIMTQFAFDAEPIVKWLDRLQRQGVSARVRLGLPGPATVATLVRFAARCGVSASAKVMAKYGASAAKLLNAAGPDRLYAELVRSITPDVYPDVTVHMYPFGGLQKMAEWTHANADR